MVLLDLKRVIDEAARTTRAAELEAAHLAVSPRSSEDLTVKVRSVLERLASADFEAALSTAQQYLQTAIS